MIYGWLLDTSQTDLRYCLQRPQLPEMQRPVAEGGVGLTALRILRVPVVLDAEYAGPDDVFRDVKALWGYPGDTLSLGQSEGITDVGRDDIGFPTVNLPAISGTK